MAKQTLPVNFKDDILASSMGGKRRYNLIQNSNGTVSLEDVTSYTQVGSDFGAAQMNQTNKAVNESCDKANVIDDLDDIMANQASGMIAGAKAVAALNANLAEKVYSRTDLPIADFYDVTDFDLRKRGNEVFFNVSLSMQPGAQFDPNTLYSIGPSPMLAELRPKKVYFLNGYGCDSNWGNPIAISTFVDTRGYVRYCASTRKTYFKISGHWFVD